MCPTREGLEVLACSEDKKRWLRIWAVGFGETVWKQCPVWLRLTSNLLCKVNDLKGLLGQWPAYIYLLSAGIRDCYMLGLCSVWNLI